MALRRCWRLTGLLLRLPVPPGSSSPVGRLTVSSFINTYGGFKSAEFQLRRFSSEARNTDVSYERLKQLLADGKAVVVDVREPWELREYGLVPGSVNVPCESKKPRSKLVASSLSESSFYYIYILKSDCTLTGCPQKADTPIHVIFVSNPACAAFTVQWDR
ncbi:hypothetical protein XENORESO_001482 [Xenotaenia resolanae]|uniref:Rhodanese domain-containing protein n=1 Tax=Xenotaenia resolanae TaxID=208358 RepID=A0ABV0WDV7_9TELE